MKPIDGFKLLLAKHILSAPVWDEDRKEYTGFLDVRDLVASALHVISEKTEEKLLHDRFLTTAVEHSFKGQDPSLAYLSRRNPFKPLKPESTLLEAAELLRGRNVHRVPILNEEGRVQSIVSQSSIVDFLLKHKAEAKSDLAQTLQEINVGFKPVKTVKDTDTARSAFTLLAETNLSGIGVVDELGTLIGNTSARDIKYFIKIGAPADGLVTLESPILDYLALIRQVPAKTDKYPVSAVKPTTTLARLLGIMGATKYHRVFIEDADATPIGVVSVTDLLVFILKDDPDKEDPVSAAAAATADHASLKLHESKSKTKK
eukprot:gb/GEZN01011602.1/.p1 GENE.gb/GEZN01011602.1/~~gb/GEZN01011602.1/.p1  ORF type:complete len:324 (+),score=43.77 gb/GEZN01011602.1/:24-974(+)